LGEPRGRALTLRLPLARLEAKVEQFDDEVIRTPDDLIVAFANEAARSPAGLRVPGVLIARRGEDPGLAVVGDLDEAAVARVEELYDQIQESLDGSGVHVSYRRAEQDVQVLARRLEVELGGEALGRASFAAVPRGGLIVLGMLSMALGLRHEQIASSVAAAEGDLLVVVDDCGLSGYRLKQAVAAARAREVVVALLYAPDELRARIEAREPRVRTSISAGTLEDLGPRIHGDGYPAWVRRWQALLGDDRYWIGRPAPITFAWKEPDRSFVNRATGEREAGWRLTPSPLRPPVDGGSPSGLRVAVQPPSRGPLSAAADVFVAESDGAVLLVGDGPSGSLALSPIASQFWRALSSCSSIDEGIRSLAARYDVERHVLERDVWQFLDDLVAGGFIHPPREPEPTSGLGATS
jgi:hypothetical protein